MFEVTPWLWSRSLIKAEIGGNFLTKLPWNNRRLGKWWNLGRFALNKILGKVKHIPQNRGEFFNGDFHTMVSNPSNITWNKSTWQFCWWPFWDGENVTLSKDKWPHSRVKLGDQKVTNWIAWLEFRVFFFLGGGALHFYCRQLLKPNQNHGHIRVHHSLSTRPQRGLPIKKRMFFSIGWT